MTGVLGLCPGEASGRVSLTLGPGALPPPTTSLPQDRQQPGGLLGTGPIFNEQITVLVNSTNRALRDQGSRGLGNSQSLNEEDAFQMWPLAPQTAAVLRLPLGKPGAPGQDGGARMARVGSGCPRLRPRGTAFPPLPAQGPSSRKLRDLPAPVLACLTAAV